MIDPAFVLRSQNDLEHMQDGTILGPIKHYSTLAFGIVYHYWSCSNR